MAFHMTRAEPGQGDFTGYIKYNAKAGRWYTKPDGGGEEYEVKTVAALMDLEQIKSGWFLFAPGVAPDIAYDTDAGMAARPSEEHARGFRVVMHSPKNIGGTREWTATSRVCANSMLDLLAEFNAAKAANPGKVPLVACSDVAAVASKFGTNYEPRFSIKSWHARPAEMPLEAAPAAPAAKPAGAQHAPPPRSPAPVSEPAVAGAEF